MPHSLETLGEILTRVEQKVDKVNGSVASLGTRVAELEKKDVDHESRIGTIEMNQKEARKAHSNFIWKVMAPVGVVCIISVAGLLIRLAI